MGANTKIEWCDFTFNPWRGCQKIAPGCANCYADSQSKRNPATLGVWGPSGTRVVASEAMWREPIKWDKAAACLQTFDCANGDHADCCSQKSRPRVFCASLADVFERWGGEIRGSSGGVMWDAPGVPWQEQMLPGRTDGIMRDGGGRRLTLDDVLARLFATIDATPNLDWMLLTKRPENIRRMWRTPSYSPCVQGDGVVSHDYVGDKCQRCGVPRRENVWLGVSIACQDDADRLVPELLKCRDLCAKTFLSIEPLLDDIDIRKWLTWALDIDESRPPGHFTRRTTGIDWVIVGGESGPNARPCDVGWVRSIVRQCRDAGVPVFVKQVGAVPEASSEGDWEAIKSEWPSGVYVDCPEDGEDSPIGFVLCDPKGGDPAEWPEDLRVREVPT